MVKKFKDWRDKLTWQQVQRIMRRVIIYSNLCLISFILFSLKYYAKYAMAWISFGYYLEVIIVIVVYELLHVSIKKSNFENDKLRECLKEEKFTQVYLKRIYRRGVDPMILDGYDGTTKIKYYAMKQGDNVYIVSKRNEKELKKYPNETWKFFANHFTFEEEEE